MVLSASPILKFGAVAVLGICLAGTLAACDTTQNKAARLKIRNDRQLADTNPVKVTTPAPGVEVLDTDVVNGKGGAVAVTIQNASAEPVTDLPLVVSVRDGGKEVELNGKPKSYYQAHAPALAPGAEGTWIFTSRDRIPDGAVTARVGVAVNPPATADGIPNLTAEATPPTPTKNGATIEVEVSNPESFPQYNVPVYAWAKSGDTYVAAGQALITDIHPGSSRSVQVKLIGDPGNNQVEIFAPATIFK